MLFRSGAWSFRTVTQSIMQRFGWWAPGWGADSTAIECATTKTGVPYATAAKAVEWVPLNVSIPTGFWRSVGASINTFVIESAVDELAAAAGMDEYAFRKNLLAKSADPNAPRFAAVLDAAWSLANTTWGVTAPTGRTRSISLSTCFDSIVSTVVEVSKVTSSTGVVSIKVNRVAVALDCGGVVVNPNAVEAQLQGGVAYGLTAALWSQITWTSGKTDQTNFNKYRMAKNGDMLVGNDAVGAALARALGPKPAILLRGHGAVVVAEGLHVVVGRAYYMSSNARELAQALALGGKVTYLNADEARQMGAQDGFERAWTLWKAEATRGR